MAQLNNPPSLPRVTGAAWDGVNYFCTTRAGGVSLGACATLNLAEHTRDDPMHVRENRRRLAAQLPSEPLWLNQVHGIQVVDADTILPGAGLPTADAAVTTQPNRVLAILTADCLPVVVSDTQGRALGVAHAGWRGLANGVLEQTLQSLRAKHQAANGWRAWIGPAISQPNFEVGADVFQAFVDHDTQARQFFIETGADEKWLADLPGLAMQRLRRAGVATIELSGLCTYAQPGQFYSYRREPRSGRIVTVAWLT